MGILAWIIFGLIAGVIAKLIMPGRDGGGFILTCILGIVGAVVGGWLATRLGYGGDITGVQFTQFYCCGSRRHRGAGGIQTAAQVVWLGFTDPCRETAVWSERSTGIAVIFAESLPPASVPL